MSRHRNPFAWWRMIYWRLRWHVYPRHRYTTRCQYCAAPTGETMHAWATEDVCARCAADHAAANAWTPDDPEYVVETGDVGA